MSSSQATGEGSSVQGSRSPIAPLVQGKSAAVSGATLAPSAEVNEDSTKSRKRDFFKFGKKSEQDKLNKTTSPVPSRAAAPYAAGSAALRPASPLRSPDNLLGSASPQRTHPYGSRGSVSSRHHSPASSMIFERNVQEDIVPQEVSAHLPSHILTENHIAPALDDASELITNRSLDPDTVEIVTHATHQPAAVTITGPVAEQSFAPSMHDSAPHIHREDTDDASNYGAMDTADVRRLSFISFADVVHAEQEHSDQRRDSALLGHPALAPRSPSPTRSPVSSPAFGTSPPTSMSASGQGLEASPSRGMRGFGSPVLGQSSPLAAEYNVETMRQALRKTESGDLSGFKSTPMSAAGADDGAYGRPNESA